MKTKFYTFDQNNSGGYFVKDETNGICETVIIEANDSKQALSILEALGDKVDGFWSYCSCCGERWSMWIDEDDAKDVPSIYDTPIEDYKKGMFRESAFVHYLDGTIKKVEFPEKENLIK